MNQRDLRELREEVFGTDDEPKTVTTREAFLGALNVMRQLKDGIESSKGWTKTLTDAFNEVATACTRYALDHVTAFDEPLSSLRSGVKNGELTMNGIIYRLTITDPGKPVRECNGNFDKDFVAGLPDEWCEDKRVPVISKIKAASQEERDEFGITCPTEYKWKIEPEERSRR